MLTPLQMLGPACLHDHEGQMPSDTAVRLPHSYVNVCDTYMYLNACVRVYMYVHMCARICAFICKMHTCKCYVYIHMYTGRCLYLCVFVHGYVYMSLCVHASTSVCVCIGVHACACMLVCTHPHPTGSVSPENPTPNRNALCTV